MLLRPRPRHDGHHLVRILVFGCGLNLIAVEIDHDLLPRPSCSEVQAALADGYLSGSDTDEAAKIDDRRARATGLVDEYVDDAPHRLAGSAADLLAEDARHISVGKLLQARAFGWRRLCRTIGPPRQRYAADRAMRPRSAFHSSRGQAAARSPGSSLP